MNAIVQHEGLLSDTLQQVEALRAATTDLISMSSSVLEFCERRGIDMSEMKRVIDTAQVLVNE